MSITWLFLGQVVLALGLTIYRDCISPATKELDDLVWEACLFPGGKHESA